MAIDSFLYFSEEPGSAPKIEGETQDSQYKKGGSKTPRGAFEINSYSFGVENVATIGSKSGGAGAGKANFDVFEIAKNVDSASPYIFQACTVGAHYDSVTLALRRAGGQQDIQPYIVFTFKLVFLTSVKWSGSGDDVPEETIQFAYGALKVEYSRQKPDGTMMAPDAPAQWSQVLNAETSDIS
jgi:type VI secretion system secreted protein Hcp